MTRQTLSGYIELEPVYKEPPAGVEEQICSRAVNPFGREISIKGEFASHPGRFIGRVGGFEVTGNQQEILWFCQALAYLEDRPELRALIRRVEDHGIAINLDQESPSELFRRWREIRWNPTLAQEIEGGRVLSPALALWHELVHADGYLRFPDRYDQRRDTPKQAHKNWEEARAIAAERDAARLVWRALRIRLLWRDGCPRVRPPHSHAIAGGSGRSCAA